MSRLTFFPRFSLETFPKRKATEISTLNSDTCSTQYKLVVCHQTLSSGTVRGRITHKVSPWQQMQHHLITCKISLWQRMHHHLITYKVSSWQQVQHHLITYKTSPWQQIQHHMITYKVSPWQQMQPHLIKYKVSPWQQTQHHLITYKVSLWQQTQNHIPTRLHDQVFLRCITLTMYCSDNALSDHWQLPI